MSENKLYEKVLEISKSKVSELTWNNILFEANLDLKAESEADPEQVSLLQSNIQELQIQIQNLQEENTQVLKERDEIIEKVGSKEKLDSIINDLTKLPSLQDQVNKMSLERSNLQNSLNNSEKNLQRTTSQLQSASSQLESFKSQEGELSRLLETNSNLNNELAEERIKNTKYDDLHKEFIKREDKFNNLQSRLKDSQKRIDSVQREKSDVESALVTQKKLYEELLGKSKSSEDDFNSQIETLRKEIEKLKKPKKRGRPPKKVENPSAENIDGGSLESASL